MFARYRTLAVLVLAILVLPLAAADAEDVVLQPGSAAGQDTWVGANEPGTNHGNESAFYFGGYNGSEFRLYLRFDLSAYGPAVSVETAQLDLYMFSQNGFIYSYNYGVYAVEGAWSETGLNWSNQPACAADPVAVISGNDWHAQYGTWRTVPALEGLVQDWIDDPASNFGVVIKPVSGFYGYPQFWTCEYSNASLHPKLAFTTTAVDGGSATWGGVKELFR